VETFRKLPHRLLPPALGGRLERRAVDGLADEVADVILDNEEDVLCSLRLRAHDVGQQRECVVAVIERVDRLPVVVKIEYVMPQKGYRRALAAHVGVDRSLQHLRSAPNGPVKRPAGPGNADLGRLSAIGMTDAIVRWRSAGAVRAAASVGRRRRMPSAFARRRE
jgi:hypothetical protein